MRILENLVKPGESLVLNTSEPIHVGSVMFDGLEYVSYMNDRPLLPNDHCVHKGAEVLRLMIATDDVGIRNIEFLGNREDTAFGKELDRSTDRLWYRIIQPRDLKAIRRITVHRDVSRIIVYQGNLADVP